MAKAVQESEDKRKSRELASHWKEQIEAATSDTRYQKWIERGRKILTQYRGGDPVIVGRNETDVGGKKLNLYWSNTETLKPAIYSKTPEAIVERRFLDKDVVGKVASQILERALRYEISTCGYHHTMKMVRDDYLQVGQGVPWIRYNPEFGESVSIETTAVNEITDEATGEELDKADEEKTSEQQAILLRETLSVDYVNWEDFIVLGKPRVWCETEAVAKRAYMSRYDLKKKFGDKIGKEIPLDHSPGEKEKKGQRSGVGSYDIGEQATVYEVWCKYENKVYFVAKGYDYLCGEADALGLEDFWPFPRPIFANPTNDTLIPVPFFIEAQDQYLQINDLTKRIDILTDACRVIGFYDSSNKNVSRAFTEAQEPQLIPVDNWAMWAEKGGARGTIDFVPIDLISKTLETLIKTRQQMIQDLDRLTGIFDIMRGETDANETKGAQDLKQQNGYGRLRELQDEFARLCRDTICIMGEVISEHYDPKTIIQISGALYDEGLVPEAISQQPQQSPMMGHNGGPPMQAPMPPAPMQNPGMASPPPPVAPPGAPLPQGSPPMPAGAMPPPDPQVQKDQIIAQALELLKNEKLRGFRIDIETDSTIQPDANRDKQAVNEFITAVTAFVEKSSQVSAMVPAFAPLAAKFLMFAARRYRVGRDLESAIEDFAEEAMMQAKQAAANPKPSPEEIKAQTEQMKAQAEIKRQEIENQGEQANGELDYKSKLLDVRIKEIEMYMKQLDHNVKVHTSNMDLATAAVEASAPDGEGEGKSNGFQMHPHVMATQLGEVAKRLDDVTKRLSTPKRVVRDQSGKAIGLEPVQ